MCDHNHLTPLPVPAPRTHGGFKGDLSQPRDEHQSEEAHKLHIREAAASSQTACILRVLLLAVSARFSRSAESSEEVFGSTQHFSKWIRGAASQANTEETHPKPSSPLQNHGQNRELAPLQSPPPSSSSVKIPISAWEEACSISTGNPSGDRKALSLPQRKFCGDT